MGVPEKRGWDTPRDERLYGVGHEPDNGGRLQVVDEVLSSMQTSAGLDQYTLRCSSQCLLYPLWAGFSRLRSEDVRGCGQSLLGCSRGDMRWCRRDYVYGQPTRLCAPLACFCRGE
jgi:hypothetical protein